MSTISETAQTSIDLVADSLEHYANRGVFRGFSRGRVAGGKASFRMMWHRDRMFDFVFDFKKDTLRFPHVLPEVAADSSMYKEFKQFVRSRQSETLPEHRRIDIEKAEVKPYNRGGSVSLTLKVKDGDHEYGTRKLVHLVHEVFMDFLYDGRYYEYMIEQFELDPDEM